MKNYRINGVHLYFKRALRIQFVRTAAGTNRDQPISAFAVRALAAEGGADDFFAATAATAHDHFTLLNVAAKLA
jgi:hypothetical protein